MFRSILIDQFMTQQPASTTVDTDLMSLVDMLLERGISGAPVLDASLLVGQISLHDLLRAVRAYEIPEEPPPRV